MDLFQELIEVFILSLVVLPDRLVMLREKVWVRESRLIQVRALAELLILLILLGSNLSSFRW